MSEKKKRPRVTSKKKNYSERVFAIQKCDNCGVFFDSYGLPRCTHCGAAKRVTKNHK